MGLTYNHALGRDMKFFISYEGATPGTFVKPVAGAVGAVSRSAKILSSKFEQTKEQKPRSDPRQTRSLIERIRGKSTVSWSIDSYVIPGNPPDLHQLFYAAFGSYSAPTYSLTSTQTIRTLSLTRGDQVIQESIAGAWVDELTFSFSGGDEPKLSASGGGMSFVHTGAAQLNGAMVASATMVVEAADRYNINAGSMVQVGSDTKAGAGYLVTAAGSAPSYTIDGTASASDDALVAPYLPVEDTAGSPINGISGSVTFGGFATPTQFPLMSGEITIKNNHKALDDQLFSEFPTDVIPGWREVSGTLTVRLRRDVVILYANRQAASTRAIVIDLGTTGTGLGFRLSIPKAELDFSGIEVPESEEATVTLPFVALANTSAGDDEITLLHTF